MGDLMTLESVAAVLECSYEHARTLCAKGKLPFINIGTGSRVVYRVHPDDLQTYLHDRRRAAGRLELENVRTSLKAFAAVESHY